MGERMVRGSMRYVIAGVTVIVDARGAGRLVTL